MLSYKHITEGHKALQVTSISFQIHSVGFVGFEISK